LYHGMRPMCLQCADLIDRGMPPRKPPSSELRTSVDQLPKLNEKN